MYAGGCSALAAVVLIMGSRGLETAVANGDTRTISLHHIHTNEDITITFKRDGRYDEEALKKLNWFVRDWRKEEEIAMDPRLFDLVWEASREVGGDKVIHVVCGYRSPATNAMLRARSSGVAKFSQHPLGKAMDFFIPGSRSCATPGCGCSAVASVTIRPPDRPSFTWMWAMCATGDRASAMPKWRGS
jgi:uncharacterized protein YcbK (DUF882 family)